MKFRFTVDSQHVEAESLEASLAQFSLLLWFPGIVYAQEIDQMGKPIGQPLNLRVQTPEGLAFDQACNDKKGATYGELAMRELIRQCQAIGTKSFKYREYKRGTPGSTLELNAKGLELQKESLKKQGRL